MRTGNRWLFLLAACLFVCRESWAEPGEPAVPATISAVSAGSEAGASTDTAPPTDLAWEKFAAVRLAFQIRLCDLAVHRWPQNRKFFTTHRDLQLAYIERRNLVFYYLRDTDPGRIVRDQGGEAFLGFTWTEEDEAVFTKKIRAYEDLSAEIRRLKTRSDRLARRNELRDRFERLEIDPDYLALMRETTRSISEAERLLTGK